MFNGIVLCADCHKIADGHNRITGMKGTEPRRKMLKLTMQSFMSDTWWELYIPETEAKKNDDFFEMIKDDILQIHKELL